MKGDMHMLHRKKEQKPAFKLQLMTMEFGCRAKLSTSSIPITSILLQTQTHFMYLRFPSITSIRSSTVASSRNNNYKKAKQERNSDSLTNQALQMQFFHKKIIKYSCILVEYGCLTVPLHYVFCIHVKFDSKASHQYESELQCC